MNKTTNSNPEPKAWIATDGSRKKIKEGNKVYLKDQEHFEIEMFNPTQTKVLAKIMLNGTNIADSGIALNPGQRVFIKRFIDTNQALVFRTYDISGTNDEVEHAIMNNGKVEVYFYTEYFATFKDFGIYNINTICTQDPWIYGTNNNNNIQYYSSNNDTFNVLNNVSFTSSVNQHQELKKDNIETGRVEKGAATNQIFGTDYSNYNTFHSFKSEYFLLPESRMPIEVEDLRVYCTDCGTKAGPKDNFCRSCGNNLNK